MGTLLANFQPINVWRWTTESDQQDARADFTRNLRFLISEAMAVWQQLHRLIQNHCDHLSQNKDDQEQKSNGVEGGHKSILEAEEEEEEADRNPRREMFD